MTTWQNCCQILRNTHYNTFTLVITENDLNLISIYSESTNCLRNVLCMTVRLVYI